MSLIFWLLDFLGFFMEELYLLYNTPLILTSHLHLTLYFTLHFITALFVTR